LFGRGILTVNYGFDFVGSDGMSIALLASCAIETKILDAVAAV
jgi:hypothetical protein